METKRISSTLTFLYKFIFPSVWITVFGAVTLTFWLGAFHGRAGSAPPDQLKWIFLAVWLLGAAFILWVCTGLKKVGLGRDSILISNYRREAMVPLTAIERVTENKWINIHPVTIYFRSTTEFGDTVTFIPTTEFLLPWDSHPVVEELRNAAKCGSGGRDA
jgi:hypothetical protein